MKWQDLVFISFIFIIIILSIFSLVWKDLFPFDKISEFVRNEGIWAPIIFISIYVVGAFFIPKSPFMLLAGVIFGFKWGFIFSLIGSLLSALLMFYLVRKLGASFAEKWLQHEKLQKLSKHNDNIDIMVDLHNVD